MRNPPAAEIFNEEVSNLLKRKIKASVSRLDELSISFDYEGEVTGPDADEILARISSLHRRVLEAASGAANPERAEALRVFGASLQKAFYGFEPDFFQYNLLRIMDDVISTIKGSIELWPTLVEVCYFQKGRKGLPQIRVQNQRARGDRRHSGSSGAIGNFVEAVGRWRRTRPRPRIAEILKELIAISSRVARRRRPSLSPASAEPASLMLS